MQCIICRSNKYKQEKHSKKRLKEKLSLCETLHAGKLVLAAEGRKDEALLLHIRDRDLVASEARYHFTCFRDYTRYLYLKTKNTESRLYEIGYKTFCETVIEERLIKRREVFRLARLNTLFKDTVKETEGVDIGAYKDHLLKQRLHKSHPFLKFHKASKTYLVYVDNISPEEILQDVAMSSSSSSEDSDGDMNLEMETEEPDNATTEITDDYRLLYHAALTLKEILQNAAKSSEKLPWPPTAGDLTLERAFEVVPHQLFNFIAWASGITSEPANEHVRVSFEDSRKILSSCQDIITLATKARWLMPKQCALAMAVRHMSGSAQLIGMLNGLGHCSSNSLVLEHDTALANLQMEKGETYISESICAEVPVTLVWDNNDFGEETLSGKGTTHNTNGIAIQRATGNDAAPVPNTSRQRTRERSVNPPPLNLLYYRRGKRSGPHSSGLEIDFQQDQNRGAQTIGRRTDAAYFLMKVPEAQGVFFLGGQVLILC